MVAADPLGAKILELRFLEGETVLAVANRVSLSPDQVNRRQREAIGRLAQLFYDQELRAREDHRLRCELGLPPRTYSRLFGAENLKDEIRRWLAEPEGENTLVISGLGGIGKTALADSAARENLELFDHVCWLRMGPESNSRAGGRTPFAWLAESLEIRLGLARLEGEAQAVALGSSLARYPTLVIVDNVESGEQVDAFLDAVQGWPGASRFVFTSREQPMGRGRGRQISLGELGWADSRALMADHAQEIGVPESEAAILAFGRSIFELTGGNPLALKLVVSLMLVFPARRVVEDLAKAEIEKVGGMYDFIFAGAWRSLSPPGKTLLQSLALAAAPEASLDHLQEVSGLSAVEVNAGLQELYRRSLVEPRGSVETRRYGLHQLTETFVLSTFPRGLRPGDGG
jgi:hypothetical protein